MRLLGFFPPEFIQAGLRLLRRFSAPTLTSSLLLLLSLLHLLLFKNLSSGATAFRLLVSRLATFFRPELAIKLPPFLVL